MFQKVQATAPPPVAAAALPSPPEHRSQDSYDDWDDDWDDDDSSTTTETPVSTKRMLCYACKNIPIGFVSMSRDFWRRWTLKFLKQVMSKESAAFALFTTFALTFLNSNCAQSIRVMLHGNPYTGIGIWVLIS